MLEAARTRRGSFCGLGSSGVRRGDVSVSSPDILLAVLVEDGAEIDDDNARIFARSGLFFEGTNFLPE